MATRSIVARPDGKGGWRGRYVHWDGHPDTRLPILNALIARDGAQKVQDVITGHYGWSSLDAQMPEQFDTPARDPGYGDGRFEAVGGYGVAYTDMQAGPDEWYTNADEDLCGAEYVYIITDEGEVIWHESY